MLQPFWKSLIVSLKVKHMLTIRTSSSTLRNLSNRSIDVCPQRIVYVHFSRIHNSQKLENNQTLKPEEKYNYIDRIRMNGFKCRTIIKIVEIER